MPNRNVSKMLCFNGKYVKGQFFWIYRPEFRTMANIETSMWKFYHTLILSYIRVWFVKANVTFNNCLLTNAELTSVEVLLLLLAKVGLFSIQTLLLKFTPYLLWIVLSLVVKFTCYSVAKFIRRKTYSLHIANNKISIFILPFPASIYILQVNYRNTRTRCEICSKITIKIPERRHWRRSGVFIVNFDHISHLVLVFLLFTLNM